MDGHASRGSVSVSSGGPSYLVACVGSTGALRRSFLAERHWWSAAEDASSDRAPRGPPPFHLLLSERALAASALPPPPSGARAARLQIVNHLPNGEALTHKGALIW